MKFGFFTRKFKLRLDIILVVISILGGIVVVIEVIKRIDDKKANLEIVEFAVDPTQSYPRIKVKLRNAGGSVAFLRKAELMLDEVSVVGEKLQFSAEILPKPYTWLITEKDVSSKTSERVLSRKIDANDADYIEFIVGFEKLKSSLTSKFKMKIYYNEDQTVITVPADILVVNSAGGMPAFLFPSNNLELTANLQEARDTYTIRQIMQQLASREFSEAKAVVRKYLRSPEADIRIAAANYFTRITDLEAVPELASALRDTDSQVREKASKALLFQGKASSAVLSNLMKNDDAAIRQVTADLLGNLPGPESEKILLQHVKDDGVIHLAQGQHALVSATVIRSLAKIGSQLIVPQIPELLSSNDSSVQLAAIDACVRLEFKQAVPALVDILDSPQQRVNQRAHDALVQLTNKDYGNSKVNWLKHFEGKSQEQATFSGK